ncbi:class I SAM-dependent methyltransferase [Bacillus sp. PS06]|uniref:class I SAM-dependent methyltransferase n=1 Tax=Bacillus sp. PS06 TaxID=2764176 RepID=UPI001CD83092|nr:class I SAM-dependent methyltransferase [Bacillus sp. PS06]
MRQLTTDEAIKRWDLNAEAFTASYNEHGDIYRKVLLNPSIFSLIETIDGTTILDAGCGEGYLSRLLAERGANVTAVDYSTKMLELAKTKTTAESGISYHYGNCENLVFLSTKTFDMIISNMVIQDLADYDAALSEMYRLLKDNGYFIFSILHPCFITPESGWIRNSEGKKQYWKADHYFHEGMYEQNMLSEAEEKIVYYHRTLTSYMKAITKAGFTLEALVEPKPSKEMLDKYPQFEEDLKIANFIVFKVRK